MAMKVAAVISAHFGAMSVAFIMLVFGAVAAGVYARSRGQEALHQDVKECKSLLQESLAVQRALLDRLPPVAEEVE